MLLWKHHRRGHHPKIVWRERPSVLSTRSAMAFRRYEEASLSYTGITSHTGLRHYGLYDTVVARD